MANLEICLLTRIIDDHDFHSIEKLQIDESFFQTSECKELFKFIKNMYSNHDTLGHVPSRDMVTYRFPKFFYQPCNDPVPVLCSQLRFEKVRTDLMLLAQELQVEAESNPLEALASLKSRAAEIASIAETSQDVSISSAYDMLLGNYEKAQNTQGLMGLPFPWDELNEETGGMTGGQFIVWFGRAKSMKTFVALYIATHLYMCRKRVMYYSREMPPPQILSRAATMIAQVNYKSFRTGRLQPHLKENVFRILRELKEDEQAAAHYGGIRPPCFRVVSDQGAGSGSGQGVSWLRSKIKEVEPDIVVVDGMYLMKDDRTNKRTIDWKNVAHISQDLKLASQDFNIPLMGITQGNRDSEEGEVSLAELSFADNIGQDADAVFFVRKHVRVDEQTKQKKTELQIMAPGIREGEFDGMVINGTPCTDFSFIRKIVFADKGDSKEYGNGGGGGHQRRRPQFMTMTDPRIPQT